MADVEVHLMHHTVRVGSFHPNDISHYTHSLLKVLVNLTLDDNDTQTRSPSQFLHLVYTKEEVTVLFDSSIDLLHEHDVENIENHKHGHTNATNKAEKVRGLNIWPDEWCAITTVAGSSGHSPDVSISSITHPLALVGVTVFYVSTYETDYLFVQKKNVHKAMRVFKSLGYKVVDRRDQDNEREYLVDVDRHGHDELPDLKAEVQHNPRPLFAQNFMVEMACIQNEQSGNISQTLSVLISHMFYRLPDFFSVSFVDAEVTVVGESNTLSQLPVECLATSSRYHVVRVGCDGNVGLGFEEAGIVDKYVEPLQDRKVPVYYLCTYLTDFILIDSDDFDSAVETWGQHDITVISLC
eukprot:CFRG0173T1